MFRLVQLNGGFGPFALVPQIVDRAVAGYGEQPWADGAAFAIEPAYAIPYAEERLLREVFSDAAVAHHAKNQSECHAPVTVVKFAQCLRVAPLQALQQIAVAFRENCEY